MREIKINTGNTWAMVNKHLMTWENTPVNRSKIKIYYSNEQFFGIQRGNGKQLVSGIDPPESNWEEVAHQLYAMLRRWTI